MTKYAEHIDKYLETLKRTLDNLCRAELSAFVDVLVEARDNDRHVYIMGNGGSAATASHFACDFNKGLSGSHPKRFRFICLNDNLPSLMAYANDLHYDEIFVEQLKNFLRPGDVVIGISGSGNSKNVVKAVEYAAANGAVTVGLVGYDGGRLKRACNHVVHVDLHDMQVVEDVHMVLDHMTMRLIGSGK